MAWYNESWTKRVKVTVDHTKVGATLSDFPVYIDLSELPADFHTNCNQTDARDIRVTTSDEVTEVPREVVFYDSTTDTGELHFKAPSLSSSADIDFYIYYGNASATEPAVDATYGAENVWDSNYQAVYHLGGLLDSTSNDRDLTNVNTTDGAGKIGGGKEHSGTGQYLTGADIAFGGTSPITVSAWCEPDSVTGNHNLVAQGTEVVLRGVNATMQFILNTFTTTSDRIVTGNVLAVNTWAYICGTYSSANGMKIFVNGSSSASGTPSGNYANVAANFDIGRLGNDSEHFDGVLDEVRISSADRGADWITTEYNSQSSPSTFSTIGTAEPVPVAEDWYNTSWDYRVKITVQSSQVDATLTNFPVYVDLSGLPAGFHTNVNQTDGRDIRVTKGDGTTELPREVVFYNSSTDTGELHFKADSLSSSANTEFYIYYGNASATEPASDATYGSENVWDSNFKAVYHLQADPSGTAPQLLDSTSNSNDLTSAGSMTSGDSVAVKIGNGIDFDGSNDELVSANNIGITGAGNRTVSVWVKQPTAANKNFLGFGTTSTGGCFDMLFHSNKVAVHAYGGGFDNISNAPSYTANTLVQAYATYNGTAVNTFVNGTGGTATNMTLNTANSALRIGKGTYATLDRLTGQMDEVRVSDVVRSADWMGAEYTNQATPTTFYNVGTQEEPSAGGTGNSERGLYIQGKSTSSSERGLYEEGKQANNSERGLYIAGVSTSNSERGLYGSGSQTLSTDYFSVEFGSAPTNADSERGLYIEGKDTSASERGLYVQGLISTSTEIGLYVQGASSSTTERALYIQGSVNTDTERGLYTEGSIDVTEERGLYIASVDTVLEERSLYIAGSSSSLSERGLYINGYITTYGERGLHLAGYNSDSKDILLYIAGIDTGIEERSLYTYGAGGEHSERNIYAEVVGDSSSERGLFLTGSLLGSSERNLYTSGVSTSNSSRNIYIHGRDSDTTERILYISGTPSTGERNLFIQGGDSSSGERFLYTVGFDSGYSEVGVYISGVNTSFGERSLYTSGVFSGDSERNLYINVIDTGTSERVIYSWGRDTEESEIGIYIVGSKSSTGERGLYLTGIPVFSSRNLYLKGTWQPWVDKFVEYGTIYTDEEVVVSSNFVDLTMSGSDTFTNDTATTGTWVDVKASATDNFIRKV